MIGIGARVVTSFAQASFAQEYLMELLLKPSCPGQCYVLLHARKPGQMWWVHRCQSEGCWKRSLPPGSTDFFPLVYGRTVLQLSCISQLGSRLCVVTSLLGNTVLFSFGNCPWGRVTSTLLMGGYSAPSWYRLLHNGVDSLSLSHTGQQLCPKAGVWPCVAADAVCKRGEDLGELPPSLRGSVDALASEGVLRLIHPGVISGLGKLWKPSAPLFC